MKLLHISFALLLFAVWSIDAQNQVDFAQIYNRSINVCGYFENGEGKTIYAECIPYKRKWCDKKGSYVMRCCPGFEEDRSRKKWCLLKSQRKNLSSIVEGQESFYNFESKINKDLPKFHGAQAKYTLFLLNDGGEVNTFNDLKAHIVDGEYKLSPSMTYRENIDEYEQFPSLFDGQALSTKAKLGEKPYRLKVQKYRNGVVLVDCSLVRDGNFLANNGLFHYLDDPIILPQNTGDLTVGPPDTTFEKFAKKDIKDWLRSGKCGDWDWATVYMPTAQLLEYDNYDKEEIISNHVVKDLMCYQGIDRKISGLRTMTGEKVEFNCNGRKKEILTRTRRSTISPPTARNWPIRRNGARYGIDKWHIPTKVMTFDEVIKSDRFINGKEYNDMFTTFRLLWDTCRVKLNKDKTYIVLIPTDAAFEWFKNTFSKHRTLYETNTDDYRCRQFKFHFIERRDTPTTSVQLLRMHKNSFYTPSIYDYKDPDHPSFNKVDYPWQQASYFVQGDGTAKGYFAYADVNTMESVPFKNGAYNIIQRAIALPVQFMIDNIYDRRNEGLGIFSEMYQSALNEHERAANRQPRNLILAVQNRGMELFLQKKADGAKFTWKRRFTNPRETEPFMRFHTFPVNLWAKDYGYFKKNEVTSFKNDKGIEIYFYRHRNGRMYISQIGTTIENDLEEYSDKEKWIPVIEVNIFGIDGMVWIIEAPLMCPLKNCKELPQIGTTKFSSVFYASRKDKTVKRKKFQGEVSRYIAAAKPNSTVKMGEGRFIVGQGHIFTRKFEETGDHSV